MSLTAYIDRVRGLTVISGPPRSHSTKLEVGQPGSSQTVRPRGADIEVEDATTEKQLCGREREGEARRQ